MPLNQPVGDINADSNKCKTSQERSHSGHVGSRAVQIIAEDVAESAIDGCIESCASRIKDQEAHSVGARCPSQWRRDRIQPGYELCHQ